MSVRRFLIAMTAVGMVFQVYDKEVPRCWSETMATRDDSSGLDGNKSEAPMKISVASSAFKEGEMIPGKYTCDGDDISPPIDWSGIPKEAKSVAMISDDPDAPRGTWVHWVIYNIPPHAKGLPENIPSKESLEDGALQGINDSHQAGYGGPCPPSGVHRYYFKVYALDTKLSLKPGVTKKALEDAMKGHILSEGQLMGRYKR